MLRDTGSAPTNWQGLEFHPYANLFPLSEGKDLDELVNSIREHGYDEDKPVILLDGKVLDGRNRLRAAAIAGFEPAFSYYEEEWRPEGSPVQTPLDWVIATNLIRRHLNESQRAMVAARVATMKHGGDRSKPSIGGLISQSEAAILLNVGVKSVERATKVQKEGAPELIAAVDQGRVAVSRAAKIAALPREQQCEALAKPPSPSPLQRRAITLPSDPLLAAKVVADFFTSEELSLFLGEVQRLRKP